jgi:hypothetical protein
MEIWRIISDFPNYEISNLGNIKNISTGCNLKFSIVKPSKSSNKKHKIYNGVKLVNNKINKNKLVHRLVATTFIPNPDKKMYVDHIDGNTINNVVSNLRWATASENRANCVQSNVLKHKGISKVGTKYRARIQVDDKRKCLGLFETIEQAFDAYKKAAIEIYGEFAKF